MKDGFIVVFPEGEIKQSPDIDDAVLLVQEFNKNNVVEYCEDYEIEYDDVSKSEASFAGGYQGGAPKVFNTNEVVDEIKKQEMINCEKNSLISKLDEGYKDIHKEDYSDLDDVLEECEEVPIEDFFS
ncbi:hypothetical protein [Clostridium sp.]|uniref:hypothetical protein n=1 Tax=Clostridium sp. TaxID=1506 RepID=UPI002FCB7C1A